MDKFCILFKKWSNKPIDDEGLDFIIQYALDDIILSAVQVLHIIKDMEDRYGEENATCISIVSSKIIKNNMSGIMIYFDTESMNDIGITELNRSLNNIVDEINRCFKCDARMVII